MKTTTKYVLAYSLWLMTYGLQAQDYQWQWAKHGGGSAKVTNEQEGILGNSFRAEPIWDIVTDEDHHYYFLGTIASGSTHVDGHPVPDYGNGSSGIKIYLTSFAWEGGYRWRRVIGGGGGITIPLS